MSDPAAGAGPARFEGSFVIERPVEAVFAYLTDLQNDAAWRNEWVDASRLTDGPLGVGCRFRLVGSILGRRFDVDYETTEYEPNVRSAWKGTSGPMPLNFERAFEPVEGGTRVRVVYEASVPWLLRPFTPLLGRAGRRALDGDLPALKAILEGPAT